MKLKSNRAFSLAEVLISVAILSTVIVVILRSFTASLSSVRFSQNIILACFLTKNKLWEIEQKYKIDSAALKDTGSELSQDKNFNWEYEISDTKISGLKQLKFIVSWKEKAREKEYSMEILSCLQENRLRR